MIDMLEKTERDHPLFNTEEIDLEGELYERRQFLQDFIVDLTTQLRLPYCEAVNPYAIEKLTYDELVEKIHNLSKFVVDQCKVPYVNEYGGETTLAKIIFVGEELRDLFDNTHKDYGQSIIWNSDIEKQCIGVICDLLKNTRDCGYIDGNTMEYIVDPPLSEEIGGEYNDFLWSYGITDETLGYEDHANDPSAGKYHRIGGTLTIENTRLETACETCEEENNER